MAIKKLTSKRKTTGTANKKRTAKPAGKARSQAANAQQKARSQAANAQQRQENQGRRKISAMANKERSLSLKESRQIAKAAKKSIHKKNKKKSTNK